MRTSRLVLLFLLLFASREAFAKYRYSGPVPYEHKGVAITQQSIDLDWFGKIWFKLVVENRTGKVLVVDRNQITARLPDGAVKPREVSVWAGPGSAYTIEPGGSHEVYVEYQIGKLPLDVALQLHGFTVGGKPLALPDYRASINAPRLIAVRDDRIELKQKVHFATDRADILPDSFDLLDEVADAVRARPQVHVRIEGHTDGRGGADHNLKLSQARADAVRAYLVARHVDGAQLDARGYGATRPIAADDTAQGQEQNRRVEFLIVSR